VKHGFGKRFTSFTPGDLEGTEQERIDCPREELSDAEGVAAQEQGDVLTGPESWTVDDVQIRYMPEERDPLEALLDDPPSWFRNQVNRHIEAGTDVAIEPLCRAVADKLYEDDKRWSEVKEPITRWFEEFFDCGEEF